MLEVRVDEMTTPSVCMHRFLYHYWHSSGIYRDSQSRGYFTTLSDALRSTRVLFPVSRPTFWPEFPFQRPPRPGPHFYSDASGHSPFGQGPLPGQPTSSTRPAILFGPLNPLPVRSRFLSLSADSSKTKHLPLTPKTPPSEWRGR